MAHRFNKLSDKEREAIAAYWEGGSRGATTAGLGSAAARGALMETVNLPEETAAANEQHPIETTPDEV
jgi:hypothetical protein